jgi:ABC-type polysaccharide/polyol phosphate transport system ATPase subunit
MIIPQAGKIDAPRDVRAVFATSGALYPQLTGRENAQILASLIYPFLKEKERAEMVSESMDFSELGSFLEAPFFTYSRGMQARLFLSLLTARPCDLLILDEVYEGADEFFQKKLAVRMEAMMRSSGAVLLISHSADLVESICDRALLLHKRRLAFDGRNVRKAIEIYRSLHQEHGGP